MANSDGLRSSDMSPTAGGSCGEYVVFAASSLYVEIDWPSLEDSGDCKDAA